MIGMVISLSAFGIVSMIILKHNNSQNTSNQVRCEIILCGIAEKIKKEKTFIDSRFNVESYFIEQSVSLYRERDDLLLITLIAKDGFGNQITRFQEIICEK